MPRRRDSGAGARRGSAQRASERSEEHTSELQSQSNLVCRLLLEKKKKLHKVSWRSLHDCSPLSRWNMSILVMIAVTVASNLMRLSRCITCIRVNLTQCPV